MRVTSFAAIILLAVSPRPGRAQHAALADRALELRAKGAAAQQVDQRIAHLEAGLASAARFLREQRSKEPSSAEIEAVAEATARGLNDIQLGEIVAGLPSDQSVVVPLLVLSSLLDRGLPADQAIADVVARLAARASDRDLMQMPSPASVAGRRPAVGGAGLGVRAAGWRRPPTLPEHPGRPSHPERPRPPSAGGQPVSPVAPHTAHAPW